MSSFLLRRSVAASAGAARAFSTSSPRSVARITIVGNLADTPEASASQSSDKEYIRYTVASNSGSKENRQTSWFRVTSFVDGPRKDFLLSLPKGTLVYVEGDASISSYTDSSNSVRHGLNIVQRSIEVLKRPSLPEQGE
ncbi:hypothetical protein MKX07_006151 [Trichoderma sp. CBMAI-0711]|uniref:Predicted protein n=3 Tax=Trichoderma TaxID=5543 RepID=G0RD23_HYPJQ|nr:uncharacterized protein TRIREDRAFT_75995 [Trichoderma reesei QM6a]EGR50901.1 predicted protein [Trichoderma reesei QM6a]ETS05562.1 ssDNA binding protein [Trichoderma reesei RUT C-30]KAK1240718.1 hypothetical protein MKX07_006151 [Trichoderma sp. CBMAI-0711]OTA08535.1 ssDNA binding protein [Trichoderma parareesei]